jgi:hypothetical protein
MPTNSNMIIAKGESRDATSDLNVALFTSVIPLLSAFQGKPDSRSKHSGLTGCRELLEMRLVNSRGE